MMTPDQVSLYVGKPYAEGASGPDEFNCWGLLVHIERTYFGVHLPVLQIGNVEACATTFAEMVSGGFWESVDVPQDGDGVLLRSGAAPHVGIYLHGGVLHAMEGVGVVWQKPHVIKQFFARTKYYRFHERKSDRTYRPVSTEL